MPKQNKIAEKFENLFQQLGNGKLPSVYVVQAFKLLESKKSVTSADIVADFKTTYKQGTAVRDPENRQPLQEHAGAQRQ